MFALVVILMSSSAQGLICKYGYDIMSGGNELRLGERSYTCVTLETPGCLTFSFTGQLKRTDSGWEEAHGTIHHCDLTSSCGTYCRKPDAIQELLKRNITDIQGQEIRGCNETCCFSDNCNFGSKLKSSWMRVVFFVLTVFLMERK